MATLKITDDYFRGPQGAYIVCKSQEEIDATLKHLHEMGYLWNTGENLWPLVKDSPSFSEPIRLKDYKKECPALYQIYGDNYDTINNRDDEVIDTYCICIGVPAFDKIPPNSVSYHRVYNMRDENPWFLRSRRMLYSNIEWPEKCIFIAEALNYGDEN
jgi:hypothetical protein